MFSKDLQALVPYDISLKERLEAIRAVSRFFLLKGAWNFRRETKFLTKNDFEDLKAFTKDLPSNLWRAIYAGSLTNNFQESAVKFSMIPEDVLYFWKVLTPEQQEEVRAQAEVTSLERLPKSTIMKIMKDLSGYFKGLAWKKLRFLVDSDPSLTMEDLVCEIQAIALKLIDTYEHFLDEVKIRNFVRQGVHNSIVNYITEYTQKDRARIERIEDGDSSVPRFRITTLSLDYPQNEEGFNLYQVVSSEDRSSQERVEDVQFLRTLVKRTEPKMKTYLDIVVGGLLPDDFIDWLDYEQDILVDDLYYYDNNGHLKMRLQSLSNLAMEYLQIDRRAIVPIVREELQLASY